MHGRTQQFETPSSGGLWDLGQSTWQTNQIGPFRDPDPFMITSFIRCQFNENISILQSAGRTESSKDSSSAAIFMGRIPATVGGNLAAITSQPGLFTNGAGYTVSQGYGVYAEQIGYGAWRDGRRAGREDGPAVAYDWVRTSDPGTEKTYTTFVISRPSSAQSSGGRNRTAANGSSFCSSPAASVVRVDLSLTGMSTSRRRSVPFGLRRSVLGDDPPVNTRGFSYLDFSVPPQPGDRRRMGRSQSRYYAVRPKTSIFLRIMLTSPDGTQSELNHFYCDPDFASPFSFQPVSAPARCCINRDLAISETPDGGDFLWTFSTNRIGARAPTRRLSFDPVTGEPVDWTSSGTAARFSATGNCTSRTGRISDFGLHGIEVVWHGKPIGGGTLDPNLAGEGISNAQRIQGFVGIDSNGDEQFNLQSLHSNGLRFRQRSGRRSDRIDVQRSQDFTDNNLNGVYERWATSSIRSRLPKTSGRKPTGVSDGVAEPARWPQFLTGADGNYYFDLDLNGDRRTTTAGSSIRPTLTYQVQISIRGRALLDDVDTPALATSNPQYTYLQHYKQVWRITPGLVLCAGSR